MGLVPQRLGDASTYDVNIRKETFVYDGQAGFAVVWRKFRFAYTYVIRSVTG